jgi:prolyl-tRNA editing enzyme YbaK/EbsC (Cys-tRNA(Pro) deacylase)
MELDIKSNIETQVGKSLRIKNITFQEMKLHNSVSTVNEVSNEIGCEPVEVLKTLLFVGEFCNILLVLSGTEKADIKKLSTMLNQKIKLATLSQVFEITSFYAGTVSPFLIRKNENLILLASENILNLKNLYFGSGVSNILISMTSFEFKRVFKGKFI